MAETPTGHAGPGLRFDAVVLAGGSGRRLGGRDKAALVVGDRTLLDRVLTAVAGAAHVVVVGPRRDTEREVHWCQEEPAGGGPVAALAAGLAAVTAPRLVLVAADLPFLAASALRPLLAALSEHAGAVLVDEAGRDQLLVSAWRTEPLRAALPPAPAGARLGATLAALDPVRLRPPTPPGSLPPWFDCDTEEELAMARATA